MGLDTNGAKSCKKEFFAPLLKIVNDNKNHKIYFYRSSTIYSRGGQAFFIDALPLLVFSKDPLRFAPVRSFQTPYTCYRGHPDIPIPYVLLLYIPLPVDADSRMNSHCFWFALFAILQLVVGMGLRHIRRMETAAKTKVLAKQLAQQGME